MKNICFRTLFLLSILAITNSCEYSPPEIPLTELEKPSDQGSIVSVSLTPEKDTIKLSTNVFVTYTVDVGANKIYEVKFLMDGSDLGTPSNISLGHYATTLQASKLSDGIHELKIRTYTSTNTGSIADKLGVEQYFYELKWPVVVNKGAKDQMKFTNLQTTANGIKLTWFKYDYADFQRYTVNKNSTLPGLSRELVNTTNPNLNSVVDEGYIEGDFVTYSLSTYMDGVVMDYKSYAEEIKKPTVTIKADRSIDVRWSPSKYPQNVKSCFLKTTVPTFGYSEEREVSDLAQTTTSFSKKIGFGGNYGMQLRYIPKAYDSYNSFNVIGGLTNFALGDSIPSFERGFLIYGTNSILLYNDGKFSKYNYSSGKTSDSFSITPIEKVYQRFMVSSLSGSLFGYFQNQEFYVRRSKDWSLVNKMDIGTTDRFNPNWNVISISDDGKVAAIDIYNNLQIYDYPSGTKITAPKFESPYVPMQANFSPDGKTLSIRLTNYMEQKSLLVAYSFGPNGLDKVNELVRSNSSYEPTFSYSPVDGKIIYLNYGGMYNYAVDIINPQTFVVENSVKIPEFFIPVAYDYENNRVVAQYQFFPTQEYSYLIDVKSGKQTKIVQFVGQGQYVLSNGTAFASNGRSIKMEDYIIP